MKITTKSGFKCEINKDIIKDWRLIKTLQKCQHDETALDGGVELENLLLGDKGSKELEKHIEALDGFVGADKLFEEMTEILEKLNPSKN